MCDWAAWWRAPTQSPSRIKLIVKKKKKKRVGVGWRAEGNVEGGGRRRFFIAPLSICPALQDVKVGNYGVAEWSMIKGTPSI